MRSRRYGETSVNPSSVNDATRQYVNKEECQRTPHSARLEVGRHEQEDQDDHADDHPEQSLLLVGRQPVAVDGEAVEGSIRQAEAEDLLELVTRKSEQGTPDLGAAGEVAQALRLWPRASQVAMAAENDMTATVATAPAVAKSLRTRGLATIKLSPATRGSRSRRPARSWCA